MGLGTTVGVGEGSTVGLGTTVGVGDGVVVGEGSTVGVGDGATVGVGLGTTVGVGTTGSGPVGLAQEKAARAVKIAKAISFFIRTSSFLHPGFLIGIYCAGKRRYQSPSLYS